jgi:hypothetical protein
LTNSTGGAHTASSKASLREAVNGVTAGTYDPMWHRGRGRRLDLRIGVAATMISSFALPGGNAP